MQYKGIHIDSISLLNTPKIYFELTFLLFVDCLIALKNLVMTRTMAIAVGIGIWLAITFIGFF